MRQDWEGHVALQVCPPGPDTAPSSHRTFRGPHPCGASPGWGSEGAEPLHPKSRVRSSVTQAEGAALARAAPQSCGHGAPSLGPPRPPGLERDLPTQLVGAVCGDGDGQEPPLPAPA